MYLTLACVSSRSGKFIFCASPCRYPENTDPRSADPHYGADLVHGLPTDRSDTDHPWNEIHVKKKRKWRFHFLILLVEYITRVGEIRALRWENVTDLGSVSGASYIMACRSLEICHFLCCGFEWKIGKPRKFVSLFPPLFCLPPPPSLSSLAGSRARPLFVFEIPVSKLWTYEFTNRGR